MGKLLICCYIFRFNVATVLPAIAAAIDPNGEVWRAHALEVARKITVQPVPGSTVNREQDTGI